MQLTKKTQTSPITGVRGFTTQVTEIFGLLPLKETNLIHNLKDDYVFKQK